MLLCPANLRRRKRRVLFRSGSNHTPVLVHDQGARSSSSDVNAEYVDTLSPQPVEEFSTPSKGRVGQPRKSNSTMEKGLALESGIPLEMKRAQPAPVELSSNQAM
jgi:hypothetical protein